MGNVQVGGTTLATKNSSTGKVDLSTNYRPPAGGVIEQFVSPCNGSSITVQSGTYTVQNVTAVQALTSTWADLTGSVQHTPPTGTQTVVFEFNYYLARSDATFISHDKFVGGENVTQSYSTHATS